MMLLPVDEGSVTRLSKLLLRKAILIRRIRRACALIRGLLLLLLLLLVPVLLLQLLTRTPLSWPLSRPSSRRWPGRAPCRCIQAVGIAERGAVLFRPAMWRVLLAVERRRAL